MGPEAQVWMTAVVSSTWAASDGAIRASPSARAVLPASTPHVHVSTGCPSDDVLATQHFHFSAVVCILMIHLQPASRSPTTVPPGASFGEKILVTLPPRKK